jgi:hypothetical protein
VRVRVSEGIPCEHVNCAKISKPPKYLGSI